MKLHVPEDLSLDPQHPHIKLGVVVCVCNLIVEKMKIGDPWDLLGSQSN